MTLDTNSFRNPLSKMRKSKWPSRRATSPTPEVSHSFGKHTEPLKTLSRSSSRLLTTGSYEFKGDHGAGNGQTLSVRDPPPQTQPRTINVVLFGETGVGKSSVINLIARKEIAQVSSDVNGCTMQYKCYDISFDNMDFAIFDTIGLEEPQMGVNGYLKAIEKAYELITKLSAAGGIHLLLFCMRGGRITATTQSNYRLFCECLCNTKVPIALVFTGLEREMEMENWWMRNRKHIEDYGIKSDGHACITAVQDDTPGEDLKYTESQKIIRELLKNCARKNEAFSPESHSWFARIARGMKSFIPGKKSPKARDIMKVLTQRCKLGAETARLIADMMEKGDTEKDASNDPQAGNGDGESGEASNLWKKPTNEDALPNEHNSIEAAPGVAGSKEWDLSVAEDAPPTPNASGKDEAAPVVGKKGSDAGQPARKGSDGPRNVTADVPPTPNPPRNDEAAPDARDGAGQPAKKGNDVLRKVVEGALPPPNAPRNDKAVPNVRKDAGLPAKKGSLNVAGGAPPTPSVPRNDKAVPNVRKDDRLPAKKGPLSVAGGAPPTPSMPRNDRAVPDVGKDARQSAKKGSDGPRAAERPKSECDPKMPGAFTPVVTSPGSHS